jgi:hypothetical protein
MGQIGEWTSHCFMNAVYERQIFEIVPIWNYSGLCASIFSRQ